MRTWAKVAAGGSVALVVYLIGAYDQANQNDGGLFLILGVTGIGTASTWLWAD